MNKLSNMVPQREIKFRAWDVNAKIMKDDGTNPEGKAHMKYDVGVLATHAKNEWATGIDGLEVRQDSKDFVLMQYAGLKDKNGKEIYEGDLLSFENKFHYQVVFKDAQFICIHARATNSIKGTKWGALSRFFDPDFLVYGGVEVIGNVFQNPELL